MAPQVPRRISVLPIAVTLIIAAAGAPVAAPETNPSEPAATSPPAPTPPPAPAAPDLSVEPGTTRVTATWNPVAEATSYRVRWRQQRSDFAGDNVADVAEPSRKVNAATLTEFLIRNIDAGSLLITDAFNAYRRMGQKVRHAVIDHSVQYVDGLIHTNTIEGFWSLLKRAWYGTHHHCTERYALAYAVEACHKYNIRKVDDVFGAFLRGTVATW